MGEGGKTEIVPVGAAWMVTKATCRVFLTDLRDFLAVSLGDVLEKRTSSSAFWLRLLVEGSLIILVSKFWPPVSLEFDETFPTVPVTTATTPCKPLQDLKLCCNAIKTMLKLKTKY